MAKTLNTEDLQAIREIVSEEITAKVPAIVAEAVDELAAATDKAIRKEGEIIRSEMASEFAAVRTEMATEFTAVRSEMVTKEDLKQFATKYDLQDAITDIKDELRDSIQSHETRITRLEEKVGP